MKNNIYDNKKGYFAGWYFKHQSKNYSISFIPGININKNGDRFAFIQVITENSSYNINYDFHDFSINKDKNTIKIKDNIFSLSGIIVNIKNEDINIKGKLTYRDITKIKGNIMGPFSYFPFMECIHGVLSLNHSVEGNLKVNNEQIKFINAKGYIENDSGKSFPKNYLWVQSNYFMKKNVSIMVSIADIPFLGFEFKGCIAIVYYEGKEYRLATYNGVKLISYNEKGLIIKRKNYRLEVEIGNLAPQKLLAPSSGDMTRTIYENIACSTRFKFYIKDKLVFDLESSNTSFEYVN